MLDFAKLGADFSTLIHTQSLDNPFLIHKNTQLYTELDLSLTDEQLVKISTGEQKFENTLPIASIYAGHQFGYFNPQLGDGRSCLIGQVNLQELSLKGAGITPYSRQGDGRAVLRSSIREYLCSAAMQGLNIATTKALTLVGSSTEVYRENLEMGAIVMRVAPSHIRFGHFELFASRGQTAQVKKLADFVIGHHFSELSGPHKYVDLLMEVVKRTAVMIASWQAQGFAHGVMNTDNMSILGLTIDYGPFGFLESYDPQFICNHSDHEGRYSFDQQPGIGLWNLTRLAEALSSLIDAKQAKTILQAYEPQLIKTYSSLMRQKFGLTQQHEGDHQLINQFLELLHRHKKDYANSLRGLADLEQLSADAHFSSWLSLYDQRLAEEKNTQRVALMNKTNPKFILRNYLAEEAIREAEDQKRYDKITTLFDLLSNPFEECSGFDDYTQEAPDWAQGLSVSCSS
ncbi:YdiU family protein [Candidatus Thioglobus autotrophicus]|uniref:protein adenylyltransferase SelO n=1 Tax=Candidatus Thioglobus autotrophicus TaxID=1705394 RepID=UPI00299F3059|nr:YdiU family protein [Candidatus Thioglobus autotrophicus]WPE16094.1 YdiU family protein [Candidatus Thioglobus autotrophicus]